MRILLCDVKAAPVITQGVGWLAAIAVEAGAEVAYVETTAQDPRTMAAVVAEWQPDWLWISTMTMTLPHAQALATQLKAAHPAMQVVLGGLGPTAAAEATLRACPAVDAVGVGEGEDCVRALLAGQPTADVPTLVWRDGDQVRRNPVGPPPDLSTLPPFPYGIFPREQVVTPQGIGYINATRGCPYNCTYCANGVLLRTYGRDFVRARPVPMVIRDLRGLIRDYGVSFIQFTDEMALAKPAYAAELFQTIHDAIGLGYGIMARPEALTDAMVAILVRTGCQYLGIGVECGDETFRRTVLNRNMKNADLIAAFQRTKRAGIFRSAYTMIGYPVPADPQLTAATMALLDQLEPDYAQFTIFYPFPGTKLYENCVREGLIDPMKCAETVSYYQESVIRGMTVQPVARVLEARYNPQGYRFVPSPGVAPAPDAHCSPAAGPVAVAG